MRGIAAIVLVVVMMAAVIAFAAAARADARRRKGGRELRRSVQDALENARRRPRCDVLVEFTGGEKVDAPLGLLESEPAIARFLEQHFECVRLDASTDDTRSVAQALAAKYGEESFGPKKLPLLLVLDGATGKRLGSLVVDAKMTASEVLAFLERPSVN